MNESDKAESHYAKVAEPFDFTAVLMQAFYPGTTDDQVVVEDEDDDVPYDPYKGGGFI